MRLQDLAQHLTFSTCHLQMDLYTYRMTCDLKRMSSHTLLVFSDLKKKVILNLKAHILNLCSHLYQHREKLLLKDVKSAIVLLFFHSD